MISLAFFLQNAVFWLFIWCREEDVLSPPHRLRHRLRFHKFPNNTSLDMHPQQWRRPCGFSTFCFVFHSFSVMNCLCASTTPLGFCPLQLYVPHWIIIVMRLKLKLLWKYWVHPRDGISRRSWETMSLRRASAKQLDGQISKQSSFITVLITFTKYISHSWCGCSIGCSTSICGGHWISRNWKLFSYSEATPKSNMWKSNLFLSNACQVDSTSF